MKNLTSKLEDIRTDVLSLSDMNKIRGGGDPPPPPALPPPILEGK